jgi:XRE family transcriptional regulator, fatty acid utilization regulator
MRAPPESLMPITGRAVLDGHVHDLADLLGMGLRQRAAEHREVLAEDIDDAAVDRAPAGHHAVAGVMRLLHAEIGAAVRDEHVELLEGAVVEQDLDALAGGQLALRVLRRDPLGAAAEPRLAATILEFLQDVPHAVLPFGFRAALLKATAGHKHCSVYLQSPLQIVSANCKSAKMAASPKLYAGAKLREFRTRLGLTQADYAGRLGISLSYLNQMENNHRPLSARVVLALAQEFDLDLAELASGATERMVADMREALADPVFGPTAPPLADLRLVAANAPNIARAFLALHHAHRQLQERLAQLNEALGRDERPHLPLPWEEVRDFFHYCNNYIDPIDRAAERFAGRLAPGDRRAALAAWLDAHHGIALDLSATGPLRRYDRAARRLSLSALAGPATQSFQALHQIALIEHDDLLEATLDLARFASAEARAICKLGLANYFAGAAMMPYGRFHATAATLRHDLEALAREFDASIEQVAQRLSTLQRSGAAGVPFFFVRVDQAGTITKRHSATRLQFARFGGACPLWNVHSAFETPGRFLRQLAETPDGVRYLCLARDVTHTGGSFRAPIRRYAIGLGCEVAHAGQLVYADDLDLRNDAAYQPIGVSCRICERRTCPQRAVPPLERPLRIDPDERGVLPYLVD